MNAGIVHVTTGRGNAMPMNPHEGPGVRAAREAAKRRTASEELARQEAILDGYELSKLQDKLVIRRLLKQWGLPRVEIWIAREAKELYEAGEL